MPENICPICKGPAGTDGHYKGRNATAFRCGTCGIGLIANTAIGDRPGLKGKWLLQAYFRHQPDTEPGAAVETEDIDRILAAGSPLGPIEQLDNLLVSIADRSEALNAWSEFNIASDFPLIWAKNPSEAAYLVKELMRTGLLEPNAFHQAVAEPGPHVPTASPRLKLTVEGWRRVQEVRQKPPITAQVFVAMQFAEGTNPVYDQAIAPAIRSAGFRPYRVDRVEHSNRVDDEIIGQIRRSRFMVADFTGQRQGVYFEAGMMLGLGRTVIWMCHENDKPNLHFDVRQYNSIFYDTVEQAKFSLKQRILALLGEGPGSKESAVTA